MVLAFQTIKPRCKHCGPLLTVDVGESFADAPVVSCESSWAHVGDRNVFVRCKVRARPKVTAIFWILDGNGTTVTEGQVVSEHWTLMMVGIVACNRHYRANSSLTRAINNSRLSPFLFTGYADREPKETSAHKSAETHVGNVFVTRDLDLLSFDLKINGCPGLIVQHFYVKFGDRSSSVFETSCRKKTDRHTDKRSLKRCPARVPIFYNGLSLFPRKIASSPSGICTPSNTLGLPEPSKRHLDRISRFRRAHECDQQTHRHTCLLYTSPSPRDGLLSRMPSSA